MKVLATADLHGNLPEIEPCDLLLIAGDVCPDFANRGGKYSLPDKGADQQSYWLHTKFRDWLWRVPAEAIVGIAGNHDFVFEHPALIPEGLPWTYLQDSTAKLGDLTVWGSPWVPGLPRWAFHGTERSLTIRAEVAPPCDVMLVHGPPRGYCDFTSPQFGSMAVGDPYIDPALHREKPAAYVCGHIHEGFGAAMHPSSVRIHNVALVDENYVSRDKIVEVPLDR